MIDHGIVLWFPAPSSATGENLAELHLHGGRAVVAAVEHSLRAQPGCREAIAGEFTRRAFEHGRIDLAQAEGLADLIEAETESQRRAALVLSQGALGRLVDEWREPLLIASAIVEASIDFSDEGEIEEERAYRPIIDKLHDSLFEWLAKPSAERLKDGIKIVLAGPPNVGKSSLINALAERDVSIVTDIAGTTRDRIEVPLSIDGVPMVLTDTAGLRSVSDEVEAIGIGRAREAVADADLVLWLGPHEEAPQGAIQIAAKADLRFGEGFAVSASTGFGVDALKKLLSERARALLPAQGKLALNARQRALIIDAATELRLITTQQDLLIVAEHLRTVRRAFDMLTGGVGTEDMLDTLFGRLCIGK